MPDLADFQAQFRRAIQTREVERELQHSIEAGHIAPEARLRVYQNNYRETLADVLEGIFPLVVAFVGEEFFRAAAYRFIKAHPPSDPRMSSFGERFPDFLAAYEHAQDVVYVADVAALEWAIHELQHEQAIVEGAAAEAGQGGYLLNPNIRVIISDYPLLQLWMVGKGQLVPEAVHIGAGGQNVAVVLDGFEVTLHTLGMDEMTTLAWISGEEDLPPGQLREAVSILTKKNILVSSEEGRSSHD